MNPAIIQAIFGAVLSGLNQAAQTTATSLPPQTQTQVAEKITEKVVATPEIKHATNSEAKWWQQRSKWAAILAGTSAAIGGVASSGAVPVEYVGYATTATTVLSGLAGFFGLRAGQATRPLFSS